MAVDLARAEARARRAYEVARAWRAMAAALPLVAVALLVVALGQRPLPVVLFGSALYVAGVLLLWRGQQVGSAVLPGAAAGVIPLGLALCARACGHVCTGGSCMSLCVPACCVGGVLAGLFLARVAIRRAASPPFWLAATGVAVLTGALGCSCVGFGGVVGLLAGLAVPVGTGLARAVARGRALRG